MEVHPTQKGSHLENETFSFVERESGQANADTLQLQQLLSTQHNFPTVGEASFSKDVSSERADYSTKKKAQNFKSFGLNKDLLSSIQKMGYKCPTPIQRKAIPILLSGRDVIAMARTGSGKTAAYLLPMLQKLSCHNTVMGIRGLVLSPTRELALQTFRFVRELSSCTDLRSCAIVGGVALEDQYADLSGNPDIVVATPGRFLHVLEETQMKELKRMIYLVLDEGDRLFEMGFHAQIIEVLKYVPEHAQRSLFSATMPAVLAEFAAMGLNQPVLLRLESEMKLPEHLALSFFVIRDEERLPLLLYLLDHVLRPQQTSRQVALFCATKYHAEFYASFLEHHHYLCSLIHGTLDQEARREALSYFHQRKRTILVVTDVAARGIDIPSLDFVININFPSSAKLFVHRVGRVARAGRSGTAISFVGMDEAGYLLDIRQTLKHKLSTDINSADKSIEQFERQPYLNTDVSPVGLVPNILTQQYNQMVQSYLSRDTELQALQKRANNAYKQYKRTRPAPSSTSLSLTKSFLAALPVHSDLTMSMTQVLGGNEALCERRSELLKCIAAHRNKANIFHIDDGRTPKKAQPNDEVFKRKQWEAEQFVKRVQEKKSRSSEGAVPMKKSAHAPGEIPPNAPLPMTRTSEKSKRTLDPQTGITHAPLMDKDAARLERRKRYRYGDETANYFVPYEPVSSCDGVADVDGAQSFKDATMDIHADTLEGEQARRSVYVWNAKKRRYMKENLSKAKLLMQGLRNEAGAKIERRNKDDNNSSGGGGGKRGTSRRAENNKASYARWSARTKRIIPAVGESEDPESGSLLRRQRSKYGFTVPSPLGDNAEGEENPSEGNVNGPNSAKHKRPQKNKTARKVRQPSKGKGSKKSKVRGNKKRFG